METSPLTPGRRAAIASLLDDPSPSVRKALLDYLQQLGEPGFELLRSLAEGENRIDALHARWFLMELNISDTVSEFLDFIRSLGYELETGALLLSRTIYPDLDVSQFCRNLDRIAARCRELMVDDGSIRERCRVINRVLFHELGFRGNVEDYTDPDNSFIHRVLERRKGLPITLSILYLLIADRCGLQLEPVGIPGHFLVGCYKENMPFFIDAFERGRFLSREDVAAYLEERRLPVEDSCFAPVTVREVLCRCCRNLANHFAAAKLPPLARLFEGFVDEFESTYQENANG